MAFKPRDIQLPLLWGNIAGKLWTKDGRGLQVLCIHGVFSNCNAFDRLLPLLVEDLGGTWVAIDVPGSGKSDSYPPGIVPNLPQVIQDLIRTVDLLGWDRFHVLSHSVGTVFSIFLSALLGERVTSVVAVDPAFPNVLSDQRVMAERFQLSLIKSLPSSTVPRVLSKKEAMDKIRDSRPSGVLSEECCEILLERCATSDGKGYTVIAKSVIFHTAMYPFMTWSMYEALVSDIGCRMLAIIHTGYKILEKLEIHSSTLRILQDKLRSRFKKVTVPGSHEIILDDPSRISRIITAHFSDQHQARL